MPEVVENEGTERELAPVFRNETAHWKDLEIAAACEHDDEENGKEEPGDRVADENHRACRDIEPRAITGRFKNSKRNRYGVNSIRNGGRKT